MEQREREYPCCVTPEYKNGYMTAPTLFQISANRVSQFIKNRKDIKNLEMPGICKNEVECQFYKNK